MPPNRSWTDDDLYHHLTHAASQRDLAMRLGLRGNSPIPQVMRRAKELGLDVTRISDIKSIRDRCKRTDDQTLAELVKTSSSVSEVLRKGGYQPNGGSFSNVSARIRALGLDTSHFGRRPGPGGRTGRKGKAPSEVLVLLPQGSSRARASQLRRALLALGIEHRCAVCGLAPEWQGKPLRLQVEHINGNYLDCRRANLCFLCPNCHTQTATYAMNRKLTTQAC